MSTQAKSRRPQAQAPVPPGVLRLPEGESLALQRDALVKIDRLAQLFPRGGDGLKASVMLAGPNKGGSEDAVRILQALGARSWSNFDEGGRYWECAEWEGEHVRVIAYLEREPQAGDRVFNSWEPEQQRDARLKAAAAAGVS